MNALSESIIQDKEPDLEMSDFENDSPQETNSISRLDHTDNIYKGCCNYSTDKRLLILGTQIGLSSIIIIWCGVMIAIKEEDNNGIYMSLMSSVLSFWMGRQHNEKI